MNPAEVVRSMWERIEAHDWDGVAELLAEDLTIDWPQSGHRFAGRANFLAMNQNHPAVDWHIRVRSVVADGDAVAAEVLVPHADGVDACLGFYQVTDDRITSGREYWPALTTDPIPDWRAEWTTAMPPEE